MSVNKCLFCPEIIPEGVQVCPRCEQIFKPNADIINAMFNKFPVEYQGIKYGCISAFTIRVRASHIYAMKEPFRLQVELMSRNGCVVIADPNDVKIFPQ